MVSKSKIRIPEIAGYWIPRECTPADLAVMFNISTRAVTDWVKRGIFVPGETRGKLLTRESILNYLIHMKKKASAHATEGGSSLADEKVKTERVNREKVQLELARLKGEVLSRKEAEDTWGAIAGAIKANVMAIPGKARQQVPHLTAHDGVVLKRLCAEVLTAASEEVNAIGVGADGASIAGADDSEG